MTLGCKWPCRTFELNETKCKCNEYYVMKSWADQAINKVRNIKQSNSWQKRVSPTKTFNINIHYLNLVRRFFSPDIRYHSRPSIETLQCKIDVICNVIVISLVHRLFCERKSISVKSHAAGAYFSNNMNGFCLRVFLSVE